MKIHEIFGILDRNNKLLRNSAATCSEIYSAQLQLNAKLPEEYSEWLQLSDGGEICPPGVVLYGVSPSNLMKEELLAYENRAAFRRDILHLPAHLLLIGKLCFGDYLCLDLTDGRQIVQWDVEHEDVFLTWPDFASYLENEWLRPEVT